MKVQNPIIGRARGSAGGMTFCKNYDKNVARAKAFEVSNPKTQAQQTQRAFFAELTALCADFSDDQLRTLFPSKPKTMSRRNALSKQIAESYAINGTEKTIDYSDIDTLGNAPVMNFGETTVSFNQGNVIVELDANVKANVQFAQNGYIVALINDSKKEIAIPELVTLVQQGIRSYELPNGWSNEDQIHAIPMITNVTSNSNVQPGWGTMIVVRRPPRKND